MFKAPSQNQFKRFQRLRRDVISAVTKQSLFAVDSAVVYMNRGTAGDWFLDAVLDDLKATVWPELSVYCCHLQGIAVKWLSKHTCVEAIGEIEQDSVIVLNTECRDDVLRQFWRSLTETGELSGLPIKYQCGGITHCSPLYGIPFAELENLANACGIEVEPTAKGACELLDNPGIPQDVVFKSLSQIVPSHLLDRSLFNFQQW